MDRRTVRMFWALGANPEFQRRFGRRPDWWPVHVVCNQQHEARRAAFVERLAARVDTRGLADALVTNLEAVGIEPTWEVCLQFLRYVVEGLHEQARAFREQREVEEEAGIEQAVPAPASAPCCDTERGGRV